MWVDNQSLVNTVWHLANKLRMANGEIPHPPTPSETWGLDDEGNLCAWARVDHFVYMWDFETKKWEPQEDLKDFQ